MIPFKDAFDNKIDELVKGLKRRHCERSEDKIWDPHGVWGLKRSEESRGA